MSRRVAAVTSTRADFGLMRRAFEAIDADPDLELALIVTGTHLSPEHGSTVEEIRASGLPIAREVPVKLESDSGAGTARTAGRTTAALADALEATAPDVVMLLGDRYEMHAAGVAATAIRLPLVHLCGGETTAGAVDQVWRNSLTKMAHRHLVATSEYADNVRSMGEAAERVEVVGTPGLDAIAALPPADRAALVEALGIDLAAPVAMITFHPPTTLLPGEPAAAEQLEEFLEGLRRVEATYVITGSNADAGGAEATAALTSFAAESPERRVEVASLGSERYLQLMGLAQAMAGNSSSGLIEAASFELPVVNVGSRQRGRIAPPNVIAAAADAGSVEEALRSALDPAFREDLRGIENPYGDGRTAARVVAALKALTLGPELLVKV
ncbi:MAG: UDP-N-acetylglucosamine 2-epimerase (hydrolyzing) [Thermoleophilaceae bacterium]|nr:UDP-N-acetylglucosamine 2-epimerase (hydrolyzing) [Thermoleophilaceae bacterium]